MLKSKTNLESIHWYPPRHRVANGHGLGFDVRMRGWG
jgi:hypothetical protein